MFDFEFFSFFQDKTFNNLLFEKIKIDIIKEQSYILILNNLIKNI